MSAKSAGDRPRSVRTAFVSGSRLAGWAERFGAAHGGYTLKDDDDGGQLAVMLCCVGAANALASPRRLLKSLPGALYEMGVACVVALTTRRSNHA